MNLIPSIARWRTRDRSRGQSLAEFALVIPVVLFITLIALDFGRIYLGYINLQNMARVAANYASNNATAWADNDAVAKATYQAIIRNDATATNCRLPVVSGVQTAPAPTFPSGTEFGDTAEVAITCTFSVITPFISSVLGNTVSVSASAVFPIRTGQIASNEGPPPITDPPNPAFSANNTYGGAPLSVTFSDESGGFPTSWSWDFGDGETSCCTDQDPTHIYDTPGTYDVSLVVSNDYGSSDPLVKTALVTVLPSEGVIFSADPSVSGPAPLVVTFTDESTVTSPTGWLWEFGDGTSSTTQNPPAKTYNNPGSYTVTLTVTTATDTFSSTIANYINVEVPSCTVPKLIGLRRNSAQSAWAAKGFTTTVGDQPSAPSGNYWITYQSQTGNTTVPCNSPVVVNGND